MNGNNDFIQIGIDYSGDEDKHCAVLNLYYNDTGHLIYETFDKEQIKALDNVLHNTVEQSFKATCWDIVVKKNVDILVLKESNTLTDYIKSAAIRNLFEKRVFIEDLTEEEFILLKEGLEE